MRRTPWVVQAAWMVLTLTPMAFSVAHLEAQERTSRLDRVFHGLEYRALPEEAVAQTSADAEASTPGAVGGAPMASSPHSPQVLYRADDRVHRSTDGGATWTALSPPLGDGPLTAVAESPVEPGLVWAGGADGALHLTRDGGVSWSALPGPGVASEGVRLLRVVPSGYLGGRAYALLAPVQGGAEQPLLYRTDDYGEEWASLAGSGAGLPPDQSVTAFAEDPDGSELLFAGTVDGVYVSFDDGGSWDLFQLDMPDAAVSGLRIVDRDLVVVTRDHGPFVLDEIGPLRQVMRGLLTGEPYLFEPSPAFAGPGAQAPGARVGAVFDYLLPSFVRHVRLEVLDGQGQWLTTLRGDERRVDGQRPPGTRAGVHRVTWDLTYTDGAGVAQRAGAGSYILRMVVDGLERERPLEIVSLTDG